MKRFFESGYNYIQDVVLKPGTYVFWAYIKSEFGDTFTFALANEANEWEVFDVDVEMGQWSKVYEVFTITEKKVKLDLIHRYYDSEQPVFVFKPQLIKGNIPTDAGASPFDIDSIVDDLHDNIQGIADFTNDEFADRVLSASERISLKRDMEAVETIFQSLKGSYEKLIINPFVPEAVITDLTAKYNAVTSSKTNLFNVLNLIIAGDNIVTPEEITAKDDALLALNAALYNYNLAEKEIQNALGADYTQKISAIRDFTDNEFADRYLSETEKITLSHDLDSVQTLVDSATSRFNEMLLNPFLTGADRDLLIEKYNALLDAWDWDEDLDPLKPNGLKTVILNIINDPDDLIDPAEMMEKDAALSAFNIALGEFSETEVYVSKITIDYAIEQATFWSIHATSPVIYKDAKDAVTDGHHMPVTVKGQLHRGTQIQDGGYLTVTADDAAEAAEATASPVLIEPEDYDDKSLYTIRLYDSAAKTILLDTMTIPVVFRGANGKDAINITLSNEIDSVPASNSGVVSSYDNTGTDIRVFEGATELTYDGVGTSPGTFKVTSLGIDLTVGQISSPTVGILKCVVGNISNLIADKGITQFTITGKTLGGESFSEVKEQRVTKGKMGDPGEPGVDAVAPIIIDGFWAFWDNTLQDYVKSSFSAIGDDGHSPYVGDNGNWYQWVPESGTYEDTGIKAEGDPGEDGEDGITISPNQQGYTYRADLNGDIIGSLANGMVELTITSGSTPITCPSSLSGGTPTTNGTYRVTRTLGNGITTNSSLSGGKYRITPATLTVDEASVGLEIKIMMGGVITSYPLTLTYRKQFDGADGKSTEFIFKGSKYDTTAPTLPSTSQQDDWYGQGTANEWNDDLVEPTKTLPYVWASQRKKVDGVWGAFTTPKVWLRYAEDGDGITSTTIEYAKSSSGTTPPSSGWSTSLPSPTKGWYLWTRTTTTYKVAATTVSYSVSHWAEDGDGIVSTTIEYAKSSSGTAIPTTWSTSLPTPTKGWYLWTRTTTVYKISPTTVAYSISYWSEDGDGIVSTTIEYAKSSSGTTPPSTGWSTALPSPTLGWYLWTRTTTTYKKSATTVAYSVSRYAEDGDPGEPGQPGDPGEDGKGVSSVVIWYYKSSSATTQTGGSWSTTKPDYSASFFLWTKVITTYTDNSTTETTPILDPDWHKVMAITDKFGVTTDGALIQAVMMLLREANSLDVTAGISGVRGTLKNNPSYWSGGTYAQAFALIEFLSKMSAGTTPSAGEYSNLAKIIMLHNGAGKYGDLIVEPSGRVVMVDPATGKSRLVFGVENIPTIATLLAGTIYSGSTAVGGGATTSVQTLSGSTNVTKYGATATFNGTTISINASGKAQANGFSSFAVAELRAYRNGVRALTLATAMVYFTNTVNYQNKLDTVIVPVTSSYLDDAGLYTFKLEVITEGDISYAQAESTASTFAWAYTLQGVRRQQYGLDGMMFFYSDSHFHFTEDEGLDARAPVNKWNAPGVLLSASVASTGGFANSWGAKKHGSLTATKQSTGTYAVYHNVGHTNYQVSITPASNRTFYVTSKNTNYFMVYFYTNASTPALSDTAFDFMITGNNYSQ